MPEEEIEIRECISQNLGNLIECMVLKHKPFHNLPDNLQFSSLTLRRLNKYSDQFSEEKRGKIIESLIWLYRYQLINGIVGDIYKEHYNSNYMGVFEEFSSWVRRQDSNQSMPLEDEEKINVMALLRDQFKNNVSGFEYSKKYSKNGLFVCKKMFSADQNIILKIDKGTLRTSFHIYIGLDNPKFEVDWGLFGGGSEILKYNTRSNFNRSLKIVTDYNEFFISHFEAAITNSIDQIQGLQPIKKLTFDNV